MATVNGIVAGEHPDAWAPSGLSALRQSRLLQILPLLLLAYSVLLPQEMRVTLAGQTIYPYRAVILLLAPWIFYQLLSNRHSYLMVDALALLGCGWIVIALIDRQSPRLNSSHSQIS